MERKRTTAVIMILTLILLCLPACSNQGGQMEKSTSTPMPTMDTTKMPSPTIQPDPTATTIPEPTATAEPTPTVTPEPTKAGSDREATAAFAEKSYLPNKYTQQRYVEHGSVQTISYTTKDYFGEGEEITKKAYVYLPYNYDETKQYNVLYLMHGIGGSIDEWGMGSADSKVKAMMDNLIYHGDIEPFIVVTPNGRSSADHSSNADYNSFYLFGQELRNDLIPYIDQNFATYAEYEEGYDLSAARDHRAMAGLSMGGMQTINIGMCECLDLLSWFGAFSAAPTSYSAAVVASKINAFDNCPIHYFYNVCGLQDSIAHASASAATTGLTGLTELLTDGENYMWQDVSGGHDFNVWYMGFYNFAQILFKESSAQ